MHDSIEFFFDYASPFAYIAAMRCERELGATTPMPVYLRGFEAFSKGMPFSADKLRYQGQDLGRIADHHELDFALPSSLPIDGRHALRGALVALRLGRFADYHERMFRATWAEGLQVSRPEVVCEVAADAGFEAEAFAEAIGADEVKAELRRRTESAVSRGVFGVPSFFVAEQLFWGQDRMGYVARAAAAQATPAD